MDKPINSFPGYECRRSENKAAIGTTKEWENWYRGVNVGRGGWAYSIPGIYSNVALLDVASMHPSSIILLNKLGKYTQRYADLKQARVYIKHKDYEAAGTLFDGKLKRYLGSTNTAKSLSAALKLPINAFYGLSSATFPNPARDSRDKNNIIALRGALFMKTLWDEIEARGFHPIHNKTDSVKIPEATPEIIKFVQDFAEEYGYEMEHEGTYERICLIDKSNYVATFMSPEECMERYGYVPGDNQDHFAKNVHPWTETGDNFKNPYIFKTLFSGEDITFEDRCDVKTVKDAAIYLDFNEGMNDVAAAEKEMEKRIYNYEHPDERPKKLSKDFAGFSDKSLEEYISEGHYYQFVGRTGNFFPVREGSGGGWLVVKRGDKFDSVSGSKGYRWMEAEKAKLLCKQDEYDPRYFDSMIDKAIKQIEKFGSFERFIDISRPYEAPATKQDDLPWTVVPCGDNKYNTCMECPCCKGDICSRGYSLASYIENGTN